VNMDQTMVRFDTTPKYTKNQIGDKSVRIATTGVHKKGATVALAASANGFKFPALIIFKEPGGKLGPRVRSSAKC